jgi:hypothetical protein
MQRVNPSDQAAGLRRRSARLPPACTYCFFDSAEWLARLANALQQTGQSTLLIDRQGRLFAGAPTRSLFDWEQQLARGELHTQPLSAGEGWYAPGLRADAPALREVARAYDHLLFDEEPSGAELILMPEATQRFLIEVQDAQPSRLRAYTLLKTLSHVDRGGQVTLLGDPAACAQLHAAACRFLPPLFARTIDCAADGDTAFSALAVRMPGEETRHLTRFEIENHESMALRNG